MRIEPPAVDADDDVVAIRATWMRGGTSKGVFFAADDLPGGILQRPSMRDLLLSRLIGSPDPYARHTDGLGGATSSTSKVVIVSRSLREDCDVDFLFGAVSIDEALIDWSGNCGNLSAAVGPFAIASRLGPAGGPRPRADHAHDRPHLAAEPRTADRRARADARRSRRRDRRVPARTACRSARPRSGSSSSTRPTTASSACCRPATRATTCASPNSATARRRRSARR